MTGPEHYRQAELLIEHINDPKKWDMRVFAAAQVHATLALAAATAVGTEGADSRAWADAAGTKPGG